MKIEFHDNFDIIEFYTNICNRFKHYENNKKECEEELERMRIIYKMAHNPIDRDKSHQILRYMNKIVPMVVKGTIIGELQRKTAPYIIEYYKLRDKDRIFGIETCPNVAKRIAIIISFLTVINTFVPIEWICTYPLHNICVKCFSQMRKKGKVYHCKCGNIYIPPVTYKLKSDIDGIKKQTSYVSSKNFLKEYMYVCGAINEVVGDQIFYIRKYLNENNISKPTRADIRTAIPSLGYKNLRDTNYIYSAITKEPLPPLLSYSDLCTERFKEYHRVFEFLPDKEGINITNIHFVIKLFLFQEGIKFQNDWFRILSKQTCLKHIRNARRICFILQEKFPDVNWKTPSQWKD